MYKKGRRIGMFLKPQKLGNDGLSEEELLADRKNCKKIGPCGVGKKALYLNSFYIDRQYTYRSDPFPVFLSVLL